MQAKEKCTTNYGEFTGKMSPETKKKRENFQIKCTLEDALKCVVSSKQESRRILDVAPLLCRSKPIWNAGAFFAKIDFLVSDGRRRFLFIYERAGDVHHTQKRCCCCGVRAKNIRALMLSSNDSRKAPLFSHHFSHTRVSVLKTCRKQQSWAVSTTFLGTRN